MFYKILKYKERPLTVVQQKKIITALMTKDVALLTQDDISQIENFINTYKVLDEQGSFVPLTETRVTCLKSILEHLRSEGHFADLTTLQALCYFEIDQEQGKKQLFITLLNEEGDELEDQANPIRLDVLTNAGKLSFKLADDYYYSDKDRLNKLVFQQISQISEVEEEFMANFSWKGKFNTITGFFSPFPGFKIQCLERWGTALVAKKLITEPIGLNVEMRMEIDRATKKKFLYVYALDENNQIIEATLNPIKIELLVKEKQLKYKIADDFYFNDLDKKNKLILKKIDEYTAEDLEFLDNFYWEDRFLDKRGFFSPFQNSVISCLHRFVAALLVSGNANSYNELTVKLKVDVDLKQKQKILKVWALHDGEVINVSNNPISLILKNKSGVIKYQVSKDYHYSDWDRLNDLVLKRVSKLTDAELEFMESLRWQKKFTHLYGGFWPLRGIRISSLGAFASRLYRRQLIKDILGLSVQMNIELDEDRCSQYLIVRALDEQGTLILDKEATIVFRIEITNNKLALIKVLDYFIGVEASEYVFEKPDCSGSLVFLEDRYQELYRPGKELYFLPAKNLHPNCVLYREDEIRRGIIKSFDGNFIEFEGEEGAFSIGYVSESKTQLLSSYREAANLNLVFR